LVWPNNLEPVPLTAIWSLLSQLQLLPPLPLALPKVKPGILSKVHQKVQNAKWKKIKKENFCASLAAIERARS
jgi:hypothetical protein